MIYLFIAFLFFFAPISFIYFYANFLFYFCFYYITMCPLRVSNIYSSKKIIITHQQRQNLTVGHIYLFIAYVCICLPPYYLFVLFMLTLFFVAIIILLLYFICVYLHNFKQHHNTAAATTA